MTCRIFLDQKLDPCLLHWEAESHPLCHQEVLVVVLICIFPMVNEVDHLFTYLFAICVPLEGCLFRPSAHVWFSATEFYEFFIYFEYNPVSDIWFANLFSHSVGCHFTLSMAYYAVQKVFVWCSPTSLFLLLLPLPSCQTHKVLEKTKVKKLTSCVFF